MHDPLDAQMDFWMAEIERFESPPPHGTAEVVGLEHVEDDLDAISVPSDWIVNDEKQQPHDDAFEQEIAD